jgi:hypothetical protein
LKLNLSDVLRSPVQTSNEDIFCLSKLRRLLKGTREQDITKSIFEDCIMLPVTVAERCKA